MTTRYDVLIAHDNESALFLADVPDLPGCYSQGDTEEQAEVNVREAIALHVQTLCASGLDVPHPSVHIPRTVDVVMD